MKYLRLLLFITLPTSTWCGDVENRATDEQAIRRTLLAFSDARNAFDAQTIAGLFTLYGEFTTPIGDTYQGRPAIEKFFAAVFQAPEMKTSQSTRTVRRVRFLGRDVAIVDVTAELSTSGEIIPVLEISVMSRQGHDWLIASTYHMHLVKRNGAAATITPPKPGPKMERLMFLVGTCEATDKYEKTAFTPSGGEGLGTYKTVAGPGGFSLLTDYQYQGPEGQSNGHQVLTWDPKLGHYVGYVVASTLFSRIVQIHEKHEWFLREILKKKDGVEA